MIDDLISRQEAIDALEEVCEQECEYSRSRRSLMCGACYVGSAINAVSTAPVVRMERKIGRWIPVTKIYETTDEDFPEMHIKWIDAIEPDEEDAVRCSECGTVFSFDSARNWCSECGARMGVEHE